MDVRASKIYIPKTPMNVSNQTVQSCPFNTRDSSINGKGAFAIRDIKKGEFIHRLGGKPETLENVLRGIADGSSNDDPLQIGLNSYILLDEQSRQINHSCSPNCGIRGQNELIAMENIKAGEELTYDYSITAGVNITPSVWTMPECSCGCPNCRKDISNVLTIPPAQLESYLRNGGIPDFNIEMAKAIVAENNQFTPPLILGEQVTLQLIFHATKLDEAGNLATIRNWVREIDASK